MPRRSSRLQFQELAERINPVAGALDTTFSSDGIAVAQNASFPNDMAVGMTLQEDGKVLLAGHSQGVPHVLRYNTNGSLDTSFSGDGIASLTAAGNSVDIYDVGVQSTGKIVICGTSRSGGNYMIFVARLDIDGQLDPTFGPNGTGVTLTDLSLTDDNGFALAVQGNDKIVVAGNHTNSQIAVVRYNAQGMLDTSFGGIGSIAITGSSRATGVAVYDDGRILVSAANSSAFMLARVGPTGVLDTTFDGDGIVTTNLSGGITNEQARGLTLDANGNILVCGLGVINSQAYGIILRYLDNGTLDSSFDSDGYRVFDFQNSGGGFSAVTVDQNGLILGAGGVAIPGGSKAAVVRFLANGAVDTTFAPFGGTAIPGMAVTDMAPNDNDSFGAIAIQSNGKIVAAGPAASSNYMGVVRYRQDSRADPQGDSYTTNEDTPRVVVAPGLLANDVVPNDTVPEIELVTLPAHGTLQLQQDGSFTYTPHANYHGPDSFQYQIIAWGSSPVATVNLTVVPQPEIPVSLPESYSVSEPITIVQSAATGVLANDYDPDNEFVLTATIVDGPSIGVMENFNSNGSFSYRFPEGFFGTTTFTYQASNGFLSGPVTTVTLARQELVRAEGSVLVVGGTDSADTVRIRSAGGNRLLVELSTPNKFIRAVVQPAPGLSKFTGIAVHLVNGDDRHDSTTLALPTTVFGGLGNDVIRTGRGKDILHGDRPDGTGVGDDTLDAGEGQSTITGGGGNNSIRTGKFADTITVGDGANIIFAGAGNDTVTAGNGNNEIVTDKGNDLITAGSGNNFINSGTGLDMIRTTTGNNFIDAGSGDDDVRVEGGNNTILGDTGNDVLIGGAGNDVIEGGTGKDFIVGGLGTDKLTGDAGDDILIDGTVTLTAPTTDSFAKIILAYKPKKKPATQELLTRFAVTSDAAIDSLVGGLGTDWFWFNTPSEAFDIISIEPRNELI